LGSFCPSTRSQEAPQVINGFLKKLLFFFSLSVAAAAGADALIARLAVVSIGQPSVFFSLSLQQAKLLWKVSLSIPWVGSSAEELKRKHKKAPGAVLSLSLQQAKLLWKVSLSIPWVGSSAEELKRKHKKAPGAVLSLSRSALFLSIVAADDFETRAGTVRRVWWSPPCHVTTLCASLYSLIRS
jgi:uncharacterized membrane protein